MKKYFDVELLVELKPGEDKVPALFVFPVFGLRSWLQIESYLERQLPKLQVELVVIAYPGGKIARDSEQSSVFFNIIRRLEKFRRVEAIYVCDISSRGLFSSLTEVKGYHSVIDEDVLNSCWPAIQQAGIGKVVASTNILNRAPAGYFFQKGSSRASNYFIRAANALCDTESVYFMALCLLRKLDWDQREDGLDSIYIDSMSIMGVAVWLDRLMVLTGQMEAHAEVVSFHSYDGLKQIEMPPPGSNNICIVSASTSGALASLAQDRLSIDRGRVVTLFTLGLGDDSEALFDLNKPPDYKSQAERSDKLILVKGEDFLFHSTETKVLDISISHEPKKLGRQRQRLMSLGAFSVGGRTKNTKRRSFLVDGTKLLKSSDMQDWLRSYISATIPFSISAIVHPDEPSSKEMARLCKSIIEEKHWGSVISILSESEILEDRQIEGAVLVVGSVVRDGTAFLSISRDLRGVHKNARRYFLAGIVLSESEVRIEFLRKNLEKSAVVNFDHVFTQYAHWICDKNTVVSSLEREEELIRSIERVAIFSDRLALLQREGGLDGDSVFYQSAFDGRPLTLRDEFVFGGGLTGLSQVEVLLIVSWVLQNARKNVALDPALRIKSDLFVNTVISPESFSRYNDGVIQAAILRAAADEELDYRCDSYASEAMLGIYKRLVERSHTRTAEAISEFLLALAIGRVKLKIEHTSELVKFLEERMENLPAVSLFIAKKFCRDQSGENAL